MNPEKQRLAEAERRERNWMRWGPYLAERQWGTVREDYTASGDAWNSVSHDQSRSYAYRWGEDGLLGITDRECRLCFAFALWNGKDPILKERLFGLSNPDGNHGEDVKELYYYLDATPTSSYLKALYKYPQAGFPYQRLADENRQRGKQDPEFEIEDTGVFAEGRYFDVLAEYAKNDAEDVLIRLTISNRGPEAASLHVLPTLWQRNTWAWGRSGEGYWPRGRIARGASGGLVAEHPALGKYRLDCEPVGGAAPDLLFTDNETDVARIFRGKSSAPFVKDAFHRRVVDGETAAVNPAEEGTRAAAWYRLTVPAGAEVTLRLRFTAEGVAAEAEAAPASAPDPFGPDFDAVFEARIREADDYFLAQRNAPLDDEERRIVRQADAGLLWSRQFYNYIVEEWIDGDPAGTAPPETRKSGRNRGWRHLHARDVLLVPDKWEYPWFAAWDTAFQCVALARIDPAFAKKQLLLLCREWYMRPNGQIPAYEYSFNDVNPPVHAWAVWRVYKLEADRGAGSDRRFLETAFLKCLLNFTWWVNRKDEAGRNLFTGGFLGLDNIGVFDRSTPPLEGGQLEQADATAWMAFFCSTMLAMSLELARENRAYQDIASKFFDHFVGIAETMNRIGANGLWDEEDGFYYDQIRLGTEAIPLRLRSMVGLIPLFAAQSLESDQLDGLPLFSRRLQWFLENKPEIARNIACLRPDENREHRLLAIPPGDRLVRVLARVLDEKEFLSPYGVRSLSRAYADEPYRLDLAGQQHEVRYVPGESDTRMFGGNSNWRGPVWFPVNYLLVEALKRHHHFYGDTLLVECPTGSGRRMNLLRVAEELERRLVRIFLPDESGRRPCHGPNPRYAEDPHFRDLLLFGEYFHGDDGKGLGASHQTGWTALVGNLLERVAEVRKAGR